MRSYSFNGYDFVRPKSRHRIEYFFIATRPELIGYEPPEMFASKWLESIPLLPKSITQFFDPLNWHEINIKNNISTNINFSIVFDDYPLNIYDSLLAISSDILVVIILNTQKEEIFIKIEGMDNFFLISSDQEEIYSKLQTSKNLSSKTFSDRRTFFEKATKFAIHKLKLTPESLEKLTRNRYEQAGNILKNLNLKNISNFSPAIVNTANIYQVISLDNFNLLEIKSIEPENRIKSLLETTLALGLISKQLGSTNQETINSNLFPTIIFVYPYFNPRYRDLFRDIPDKYGKNAIKEYRYLRFIEQDIITYNYTLQTESVSSEKSPEILSSIIAKRSHTNFLDFVSYLHSTFELSPYIRVPARGVSINQYLSRLSPLQYSNKSNSLSRNLNQIGKCLSDNIPDEVVEFLDQYTDRIFAISDLPIEWLLVKDVPLAFLCDVCRIPETGLTSILSQFNINSELCFEIKSDIIERTLVICGAKPQDPIFKNYRHHLNIQKEQGNLPYQSAHIQSKKEFFETINKVRPHLLIIDSHGDFKNQSEGSYIWIGNDKITGKDIVENLPPIPLVILSCCWGTPVYGNSNTIAQAFFERGSFSVLSTYLPISIDKGFMLYFRIISNLAYAAKHRIHDSWMNFVSHNIRTSYLDDLLIPVINKYGMKIFEERKYSEFRLHWTANCMDRKARYTIYKNIKETLLECIKPSYKDKVAHSLRNGKIIPEFMLYTHLGRGDLIKFDSWIKNKEN